MPTAKTYETMEIVEGPYTNSGKSYVKVRVPKTGTLKEVRWYTDTQREAMDRRASLPKKTTNKEETIFNARIGFGFGTEGYILLLSGSDEDIEAWRAKLPPCTIWSNTLFEYFIPADREPDEVPETITCTILTWNQVCKNGSATEMRDKAEVKAIIQELLGCEQHSIFQGNVGDTIMRDVEIIKNSTIETNYGKSNLHIMKDPEGNEYVWFTSAKNLKVGSKFHMSMKVKEHRAFNGIKQTIVNYCMVKGEIV